MRLIALLALAAVLAACGEPTESGKVPTPSANTTYAQALAFAKCMRDNGLPDFPDPAPDGSFGEGGAGGAGTIDRGSPQYRNALEACKDLRPGGGERAPVDTEQLAQMMKYAKCMRDNGMPGFPDPGPNGFPAGAFDPGNPAYATASKACQEFLTWR